MTAARVGEVATPEELVGTVATFVPLLENRSPGPLFNGPVNVIFAAGTRLPPASLATRTSGLAKAVFRVALWPLPEVAVSVAGSPGVTLIVYVAVPGTPAPVAVMTKAPRAVPDVNAGAVATPLPFVVMVAVSAPPAKVPLEAGAVKVTETPLTGLFELS